MKDKLKILFVEDVINDAELIWREIKRNKISFSKLLVDNMEDYLHGLKTFNPDLIISDYSLPQFNGMKALLLRNELNPFIPFILVTGTINEQVAVECMIAGADDYVLKDNLSRLGTAVINSINKIKLLKEKKNTEEELYKSELRLKKAQSIAHVGNWEIDLSSMTVLCSEEALRIYGFEFEGHEIPLELVQKSPLPKFRAVLDEAFDNLLKYNEPYEVEFNIKRLNDGAVRSIYSKAELVQEHDSEQIKIIGVIQDITDRKLADEALDESENKYRRIFENVQDVYYETSIDGQILDVSPSIEIISKGQYQRDDLIGMSMFEFYSDSAERNSLLTSLKELGNVSDFEILLKNRDGSLIPCSVSSKIIFDNQGRPEKIIGSMRDITKRKLAEIALKESELRLKQISENSGEWIWEIDRNGLYIYSSPIVKEILGYEPDEIVNKKYFYDFFNPEVREQLKEELAVVFARKEVFRNYLNKNIRKDGREIILSTSAIPVFDSKGNLTGYRGADTDITEPKRAEEALHESKQLIEGIINSIDIRVFWKDKNLVYMGCNEVFAHDSGFADPKDLIGKDDYQMRWRDQAELYRADDLQVIETGHSKLQKEESLTTPEGNIITILTSKIPLLNASGVISGVLGTYIDISDRKRAEEELRQSYIFNESLLKTIPFGMDIVDEEGTVVFLSDNFKLYFSDDAIGKKCWNLYRDDKTQCKDCPLNKGIRVGESDVYESKGVLGGRIFEISHTGMMYNGKKAMLEIFQDITERKENEEELIRAKEKAEESDRLKTAFLHNISHEIRTPMNAIVGFSTLLAEPEVDAQSRLYYTDVIMQSSNHLLSVLTDIFDISNIEANLVTVFKSEININSALKKLYNLFIVNTDEKNVEFTYQTDLSDSDALILTDNTKLIQIISNLISNAFKFTNSGSIKFGYEVRNNYLEFFVTDTGIGIPKVHHERIFDRFYQVENQKSRLYEGTGLGLAISKAYVELLGGKIWLSSETEKTKSGTSFFFTIPFERPVMESLTEMVKGVSEGFVFPENKTILVAEDIESNFKLISYFLSKANLNIIKAVNGKEAVEKASSIKNIDLILMDIKMPVMDGYTAIKLIRESNPEIPIIAQTAYAEDKDKALECGCSGFISKPFDKKSLLKIIREFI